MKRMLLRAAGRLARYGLLLLVLLTATLAARAQTFTHPGIWHKQSDLDRMKYMVQAGINPWKGSFDLMKNDPKASYNYTVLGQNYTQISREPVCDHCTDFESDTRAAYLNSLMWYITGDQRHAAKAIQCLNAWNSLQRFYGGGTEPLSAGLYVSLMVNAAEILVNTNSGWSAADVAKFKAMLVYPGYSSTVAPTAAIASKDVTFYWSCYQGDSGRHGNQDLLPMKAVMEMGIFLDNRVMYDRGLRYLQGLPHRPDDLPYATGPAITGTLISKTSYMQFYNATNGTTIADYGFNGVITNYIFGNGQCQESSRDQNHAMLGINAATETAEIAWNQGTDLYGLAGKRIRKGNEYTTRYNVSYSNSYPDQPTPWEPTVASGEFIQRFDRVGRWLSLRINPYNDGDTTTLIRGQYNVHPGWEMPLAHYLGRLNMPADSVRWTQRASDRLLAETGYEQSGNRTDVPGWGGLTFHRPALSNGDPVTFSSGSPAYRMNVLPATVQAEDFDYFILGGQGKTYNDLTTTNTGGQYRTGEAVDLEACTDTGAGYDVTGMQNGEWLNYTVAVPVTGNYSLAIRYAATGAGGAIRMELAGADKTGNVAVPFGTTGASTGASDWQTFTVAGSVLLQAGVQSLRIFVTGTDNVYKLNSFTVGLLAATAPPAAPLNVAAVGGYSQATISWSAAISATSYSVKRATTSGGPYTTVATGLTATSYVDLGLTNGTTYYYVVSASNGIGESVNSAETSATPATTYSLVEDNFDTNGGALTGRTPEIATIGNRVYQVSNTTNTYANAVTGGLAKVTTNLGEAVDISSASGYVKPSYIRMTATFDEGTLTNPSAQTGRGMYFGFWSALPTSGDSYGNMRGIFINPDNGTLRLWNGSASATGTPVQSLAYQGTWVGGTQAHTLTYVISTVTGNISECVLDGTSYQWSRTNIFTDANTMLAGFGLSAPVAGQVGDVDKFKVQDNLTVNEPSRTPQTITFPDLADQTTSSADYAPGATASSGLAVSYTSSNTAVATIVNGLIHIVAAGTTTITATQAGNTTYDAAAAVSQALVVNATTQSGGTLIEDTFTGSGTVAGRTPSPTTILGRSYVTSSVSSSTSYSSTSVVSSSQASMFTNLGATISLASATGYTKPTEMTITATFKENTLTTAGTTQYARGVYLGFWSAIPSTGDSYGNLRGIFVNPDNGYLQLWNGSATTTTAPVQTLAYQGTWVGGTQAHTLTYTVNTSTGNISGCTLDGASYTWTTTAIFTAANTALAGFGVSSSTASKSGLFSYFKLSSKISQAITFNPLATRQVGNADFAPGATTSSGLAVTYTSSDPTVATVTSAGLVHLVGAGTVTITATQAGDATYQAATTRTRTLTVTNPITWTGPTSTDWNTATNWSTGAVPTAVDDVIVPGTAARQPTVSAAQSVHSLTLGSGATLTTAAGSTLTLTGNLTNNGGTLAGAGMLALNGAAMQTIGGSSATTFPNLSVGSAGAILSSPVSIRQALTLTGNLSTNSQPLTLLSDASGTALVANAGTGSVVGAATMQRYIDPTTNGGLGYRHYSSPVASTTVADLATSNFTPLAATSGGFPTVYSYDQSQVTATTNDFNQGWVAPASLSSPLLVGQGYTVNLPATALVDFVGTLNNGPISLTLSCGTPSAAGWNFIGNPYPSPLDWNTVTVPAGVGSAVYLNTSTSQYGGSYRSFVNNVGTSEVIPAGQGFFIRAVAAGTSPVLALTNANRITTFGPQTAFQRTAETRPLVQLHLSGPAGTDEAYVYFEAGATAGFDARYDAGKLLNSGTSAVNLYSLAGTEKLSISGLPQLGTQSLTVPLGVAVAQPGTYTLRAEQLLNQTGSVALHDLLTGSLTPLAALTSYSFTVAAGAAATGRFELLFGPQTALSTASATLSQQVELFPNPAHGEVQLSLPTSLQQERLPVTVLNALGQQVLRYTLPAGAALRPLPLTGLATGVYMVRLETSAGMVTKRLICQ